jgi:hypothetical protein
MADTKPTDIKELTFYLRGMVLELTIMLERNIDKYLTQHFCRNEKTENELNEMFFFTEKTTLGAKKDVLFLLLDKYHQDFLKANPTFKARLDNLIPHRNIFAHLEIDYPKMDINDLNFKIIFKKFKGGKLKSEEYPNEAIKAIMNDMKDLGLMLYNLRAEAYKRIKLEETD